MIYKKEKINYKILENGPIVVPRVRIKKRQRDGLCNNAFMAVKQAFMAVKLQWFRLCRNHCRSMTSLIQPDIICPTVSTRQYPSRRTPQTLGTLRKQQIYD